MSILQNIKQVIKMYNHPISVIELSELCYRYTINGHLAVLNQPYLDRILDGEKTIESRFTINRVAPYKIVQPGDVLFLKESAGYVKGLISVKEVKYFENMVPGEARDLIRLNQLALTVDEAFINLKQNSRYATLIHIGEILSIEPLEITKKDRRAWVVLHERKLHQPSLL